MTNKIYLYEKTFNIEWGDMDALGHVNNGRYFDYFQEARIEWLQSINFTLCETCGPVVVHVGCTYLRPVIYPAEITIKCHAHSLGRSSFVIDYDLFQEDMLMAQGTSKIVWIDYQKNKSISLPEKIRQIFE